MTHSPPERRRHHERVHARLKINIEDLIRGARDRLGIETVWSIEVCVCCPEDLPVAEASIWWHSELFYARLYIRCSHQNTKSKRIQALPPNVIAWLVYHELCELQLWRSTEFVRKLIDQKNIQEITKLQEEWQVLRNQEIECRIAGDLGHKRPGYLERDPIAIRSSFIKQQQETMQVEWNAHQKGNAS